MSDAPSNTSAVSAPVFTASEGRVYRRGVFLAEPSTLLAVLLEDEWAQELAAELRDAISVAEDYPHIHERNAA